jgi:uncharacterized protein YdaU (DUF1376 family)
MHHYPHYIKAFKAATAHLTRVQRSLYREAIDLYYDLEHPWDAADFDGWAHKLQARSDDEKADLRLVQKEFFPEVDGCFRNERCDREILKYQSLIASASAAGKASAEKRKNAKATPVERPLASRSTNQNQNQNQTSPNGDVAAGAGNKASKGSRLPKEWAPSTDDLAFILAQRPDLNPKTTAEMFRDYWHSKPGKDGVRVDWPATWRNWVRNQRVLPGNTALASEWWIGGTKGTLDKGVELGLTAPPQGDNNAWYHFQAQVWAKMGEGPWLNPDSRSYPIYKSLRDGAAQETREAAHAD